ncbi:hypothetical protein GQ55_3G386900 [Panicum hallii var. hallii]|uniref:Uncharacterized protein n=1 Tax=Panicum hallii var. hallii TaxID=1504633 RepID=A0A2T7EGG0_9POAL|nr:hypothetical protein GQ55_3G386900 [Panicum hallii var. hallii]
MEHKARRRHVPAFGEWNYYYSSSSPEEPQLPYSGAPAAAGDSAWWYAAAEPEACSDAWFRYSPPPRRPPAPKKARRPVTAPAPAEQKLRACCNYSNGAGNGGVPATEARARASRAVAAPAKGAARRVVRPVDADLYRVPPPDDTAVSSRPRRKRAARSLWMGCLGGFNCVA